MMAAVDHDLPALLSFTVELRRGIAAVTAGLTQRCNSGAVEGTVNRIKPGRCSCSDARTTTCSRNRFCCDERRTAIPTDTPGYATAGFARRSKSSRPL